MCSTHTAWTICLARLTVGPCSYKAQIGVQLVGEVPISGALDQRRDHLNGIEKTISSNPISSTNSRRSSKEGRLPFKQDNAGSNPVRRTICLYSSMDRVSRFERDDPGSTPGRGSIMVHPLRRTGDF